MDESSGDLFSEELFGIFDDEGSLGEEKEKDNSDLTEPRTDENGGGTSNNAIPSLSADDGIDDDYSDDNDEEPFMNTESNHDCLSSSLTTSAVEPKSQSSSTLDTSMAVLTGTIDTKKLSVKAISCLAWHDEKADKEHRQAMILEISRLLRARKKTQPSPEWIHQLPYKVRRLEEKLYCTARSLEAYLDRTTLKNRLRYLAQDITKQFTTAKVRCQFSNRGDSGSNPESKSGFAVGSSDTTDEGTRTSQSLLSNRPSADLIGRNKATSAAVRIPTETNMINQDALSSKSNAGLSESIQPSVTTPNDSIAADDGIESLSELDRQRAVNQRLQQQILENIRQQEELVRKLQSRSSTSSQNVRTPAPSQLVTGTPLGTTMQHSIGSSIAPTNVGIPPMTASSSMQSMHSAGVHAMFQNDNSIASNMLLRQAALLNTMGSSGLLPNPMVGGFHSNVGLSSAVSPAAFSVGGSNITITGNGNLFNPRIHPTQTDYGGSLSFMGMGPMSQIIPSLQQSPMLATSANTLGTVGGTLASPAPPSFNNGMPPPPPSFSGALGGRPTLLSLVGATKPPASTSFDEDTNPLSPGSFNW